MPMPEFHQTRMGQKFFDRDLPELTQTLSEIRFEMNKANHLKADELNLKEKELRLKEKELEIMERTLNKK